MQVTVKQAAELYGVSVQTIHYWIEKGAPFEWKRIKNTKPCYVTTKAALRKWHNEYFLKRGKKC